jgi:hypothetical protein
MLVVQLLHLFDTLHELGKLLELSPLVICGPERNGHLDGFFNSAHVWILSVDGTVAV